MRVQVKVTNYNIRNGRECNGESCPIALAVKKNIKPEYDVTVESNGAINVSRDTKSGITKNTGCIVSKNGTFDYLILTTEESVKRERFITKFDNGQKVKPMVFLLNLPKEILKSNANVVSY